MRRVLLFCLVATMVFAAGTASAQWSLGMRMVGTGNYFPYLPIIQAMGEESPLVVADAGIFGYKEFSVGYHADKLCFEGNFAYDKFTTTFTEEGYGDLENNLTWWYLGGAVFYNFMKGDSYAASAGFRYQYGASEMKYSVDFERADAELAFT
ncbi:MAG: hypothetical protein U9Q95_05700, partial [Candidatus Eisenbacteria bacterium]|nr:hypothetical protein [Candidatus Eisenbacteria bacterium]